MILCKRNVPIAEIRPIAPEPRSPRPLGLAKGKFSISPSFFEPLPADLLESFNGGQE